MTEPDHREEPLEGRVDDPQGETTGLLVEDPAPVSDPGPSRVVLVLAVGLSVLVMGLALLAPGIASLAGLAEEPPDLSEVQTYVIEDNTHTDEDLDYPQTPPVGGQHDEVWLACGHYEVPVREENAVHDLEHGTVWITYDPALPARDVDRLLAQLPDNGILSPHEELPSPVVVTVWGAQLALDGADDERLALFLAEYGDGQTAPEIGASCRGGTPDPGGAVPGIGA